MSEVAEFKREPTAVTESNNFSAAEVRQHVNMVQEVMKAVMKLDVHYGKIPGTNKPSLFKAGAEVLCMTFRISDEYEITDLSNADMIRYRVKCIGRHQLAGKILGQGMGAASSGEEKYKWRSSVCAAEFEATPVTARRVKYGKKKNNGFYTVEQVRTEAADLDNTVLKMACKRAKIAMTLNVTAASDMFTQDVEDMPEELRDGMDEQEQSNNQQSNLELTKKWLDAVAKAIDDAALKETWAKGVKEFKAADDLIGANVFKKAVQERGAAIKETAAATTPEESAKTDDASPVVDPTQDEKQNTEVA